MLPAEQANMAGAMWLSMLLLLASAVPLQYTNTLDTVRSQHSYASETAVSQHNQPSKPARTLHSLTFETATSNSRTSEPITPQHNRTSEPATLQYNRTSEPVTSQYSRMSEPATTQHRHKFDKSTSQQRNKVNTKSKLRYGNIRGGAQSRSSKKRNKVLLEGGTKGFGQLSRNSSSFFGLKEPEQVYIVDVSFKTKISKVLNTSVSSEETKKKKGSKRVISKKKKGLKGAKKYSARNPIKSKKGSQKMKNGGNRRRGRFKYRFGKRAKSGDKELEIRPHGKDLPSGPKIDSQKVGVYRSIQPVSESDLTSKTVKTSPDKSVHKRPSETLLNVHSLKSVCICNSDPTPRIEPTSPKKQSSVNELFLSHQVESLDQCKECHADSSTFLNTSSDPRQPTGFGYSYENEINTFMTCEHVPGLLSPPWVWIVTRCPETWTDRFVARECSKFDHIGVLSMFELLASLPVQDYEGRVYANDYCAQCHNVESWKPWTAQVHCKTNELIPTVPKRGTGFAKFSRELNKQLSDPECQRQIQPAMMSTLEACKASSQPSTSSAYKQIKTRTARQASEKQGQGGVPFTILFNFDFTGRTNLMFEVSRQKEQRETLKPRCRDWETFDPHTNMCRPVTCSKNYILVNNKCQWDSKQRESSRNNIKSLEQLNRVHQTTRVTIYANTNMTQRSMDKADPDSFRRGLAEILYVEVERIENFKLTFEPGSMPNDVSFRYEVLTQERYLELFPPLQLDLIEMYESDEEINLKENSEAQLKEVKGDLDDTRIDGDGINTGADNVSSTADHDNPDDSHVGSTRQTASNISTNNGNDISGDKPVDDTSGATHTSAGDSADISAEKPKDSDAISHFEATNNSDAATSADPRPVMAPVIDPKDVSRPMVMVIDFVLVPPHNKTDGHPQRLMEAITNLDHRFIIQMEDGDIKLKGTALPELADTSTFCPWGFEHRLESGEFTMLTDEDGNPVLYANKTDTYLEVGRFDLFIRMSGDDAADITDVREDFEFAFMCFMPRINQANCSRIDLSKDEYTIKGSQKELWFEGKAYDVFSYYVKNETTGLVQICVPQSFGTGEEAWVSASSWYTVVESCGESFDKVQEAEVLITAILGRVSLVALSIVMLTYILFPRLRNLPGINTMNLTFALLVAEAMFSEGIDSQIPWLCTAIAVCLHYLFLAAHFWMNVMSFDVYRTFVSDVSSSLPLNRMRDKRKYVPLYSLYAWGTPFLIVALCLFVDKSDIFPGLNIGYGGRFTTFHLNSHVTLNDSYDKALLNLSTSVASNPSPPEGYLDEQTTNMIKSDAMQNGEEQETDTSEPLSQPPTLNGPSQLSYCWISEPLAAFISFGAPILIIFTANCIFFARVITTISRTAKLSKSNLRMTRSNASLNRKLTGRSDAVLYLRMSTVMGFTWIFGLSSSIVSSFSNAVTFPACVMSHVLGILFTIFNISQGIFIFGAFVCNRRVLNLYRALFLRIRSALIKHGSTTNIYVVNSSTTLSTSPDFHGQ
ncbi:hypothetical protein PoB_004870700 [Plakobranchus ocellatus]|uniref:G-protein coupled receptors family 2 profile 2 domain-containing protein n=1 Tax=Plakobranchus ocellatus TaxID=259542 RepID=A0AAV4BT83_9GAST|nr:hypothetical protein PoB_004870700 [Plakobranchus ocellatus]